MNPARRLVWSLLVLLLIALVSALVSTTVFDRALAQDEPPPTKQPLPPQPTKSPMEEPPAKAPVQSTAVPPTQVVLPTKVMITSTPEATFGPTKTPIGLLPTKTALPETGRIANQAPAGTSSVTPDRQMPTANGLADRPVQPAAVAVEIHPPASAQPPLIGVVFEDDNRNGLQDANEMGLAGIAVIVESAEQQQTLLTDASGAYRVPVNPQALVRVVPPAGWQVTGEAVLPLDRARHFPLHPLTGDGASSVPAVTSSVINLTSVALGFLGLGALVWLGLLQHQRARVNSFNAWARADLRLRSETERQLRRERLLIDDAWIVALLNQAALDATGEAPGIDQIDRVVLEPIPALVGLGRDFQRLVFTPAPETLVRQAVKQKALAGLLGDSLRGVRVHSIDALTGDLFVCDDLAAALLAKAPRPIGLPRAERWWVYEVAQRNGKVAR